MRLFYEDGAVEIWHGDCREWEGRASVLVTDPPYGVAFEGKTTKWTQGEGGYLGGDSEIGPEVVARLLPLVERAAVFTGVRLLHAYPAAKDLGGVYCPSGAGVSSWGFTCFHPVAFYGKRPGAAAPTAISSFALADDVLHPCPKPLAWMRWLVGLASLPGEEVLDPFCGSGTTLRAAKDLSRRAIGIEIEERYCEIAAERCAQEVLALA